MKTLALVVGVTVVIGFSSCKKDYTCICRDADGDVASATDFRDTNLRDAKDACEDTEEQMNDNIFDPETYICTLD